MTVFDSLTIIYIIYIYIYKLNVKSWINYKNKNYKIFFRAVIRMSTMRSRSFFPVHARWLDVGPTGFTNVSEVKSLHRARQRLGTSGPGRWAEQA